MNNSKDIDPEINSFIFKLNELFKEETYNYSFYDFEKIEIKEKDKMFNIIKQIKNDENYMKNFCYEINQKLEHYEITHIGNITCGENYKKIKDLPIPICNGYYYSFTVIYKKKLK
jgi:hypothetical protein